MNFYKCHVGMEHRALDGVLVDACPSCKGIWLDGGELEMLQDQTGKPIKELHLEARKEVAEAKQRLITTHGLCPRCQETTLNEQLVASVELDVCATCNGMYFDWGELSKAQEAGASTGFGSLVRRLRDKLTGR